MIVNVKQEKFSKEDKNLSARYLFLNELSKILRQEYRAKVSTKSDIFAKYTNNINDKREL